jgi:hypothetical protein
MIVWATQFFDRGERKRVERDSQDGSRARERGSIFVRKVLQNSVSIKSYQDQAEFSRDLS